MYTHNSITHAHTYRLTFSHIHGSHTHNKFTCTHNCTHSCAHACSYTHMLPCTRDGMSSCKPECSAYKQRTRWVLESSQTSLRSKVPAPDWLVFLLVAMSTWLTPWGLPSRALGPHMANETRTKQELSPARQMATRTILCPHCSSGNPAGCGNTGPARRLSSPAALGSHSPDLLSCLSSATESPCCQQGAFR